MLGLQGACAARGVLTRPRAAVAQRVLNMGCRQHPGPMPCATFSPGPSVYAMGIVGPMPAPCALCTASPGASVAVCCAWTGFCTMGTAQAVSMGLDEFDALAMYLKYHNNDH